MLCKTFDKNNLTRSFSSFLLSLRTLNTSPSSLRTEYVPGFVQSFDSRYSALCGKLVLKESIASHLFLFKTAMELKDPKVVSATTIGLESLKATVPTARTSPTLEIFHAGSL